MIRRLLTTLSWLALAVSAALGGVNGFSGTSINGRISTQTVVANLTTTSGATVTATGLPINCAEFLITINGVSSNTSANGLIVKVSSDNGGSFGSALIIGPTQLSAASTFGSAWVYLGGVTASKVIVPGTIETGGGTTVTAPTIEQSVTSPTNALQFAWSSAATFDAGTILVYCVN